MHFLDGIFHERNHLFLGSPNLGNPPYGVAGIPGMEMMNLCTLW